MLIRNSNMLMHCHTTCDHRCAFDWQSAVIEHSYIYQQSVLSMHLWTLEHRAVITWHRLSSSWQWSSWKPGANSDTHIKNSKNHKRVILFSSTLTLGDVMMGNITCLWFLLLSMHVSPLSCV